MNGAAALLTDDVLDRGDTPPRYVYQSNSIAPKPVGSVQMGLNIADPAHAFGDSGSRLGRDPVETSLTTLRAALSRLGPRSSSQRALGRSPIGSPRPSSESMRCQIDEAANHSEIVDALRLRGDLCDFAEEVAQLNRRLADEPDEPQVDTGSLKLLARAVVADDRLRTPYSLALDEDGHAHAEWHLGRAKLFTTFRPTGHVKVVVAHPGDVEGPLRVAGTLYSPHTESFVKWLVSGLPK